MTTRERSNIITASRMRSYLECPQKHDYEYIQGYRPVQTPEALRFGNLWHGIMEAGYRAVKTFQGVNGASTVISGGESWDSYGVFSFSCLHAIPKDIDPYEAAKIRAAIRGVVAVLRQIAFFDTHEILGVEVPFAFPHVNPKTSRTSPLWVRGGKIDCIVKHKATGRVRVMEHKCVTGDSRVFDPKEDKTFTVKELFDRGTKFTVMALDQKTGKMVEAEALPPREAGVRPVVTIATSSGRVVTVSENHPLLVDFAKDAEWVEASEVKPGDMVAVPKCSRPGNGPARNEGFTNAQVQFIGLMIGDGTWSRMRFSKNDERVLALFDSAVERMGDEARIVRQVGSGRCSYADLKNPRKTAAWDLAARLGMTGTAKDKHIPDEMMNLPRRQTLQLLGALWATDGCVDIFKEQRGSSVYPKLRIAYVSRSRTLCYQVAELLSQIGVPWTVCESSVLYKGERRPYWTTKVVEAWGKKKFLEAVDIVKYPHIVKEALGLVSAAVEPESGVMWEKVESVTVNEVAPEMMYDIEVPGVHTFVVDGVITHNTTSDSIGIADVYWQNLSLDNQISQYVVGTESMFPGITVDEVVYDVLRKTLMRPAKATPEADRKYTQPKYKACPVCKKKGGETTAPHEFPFEGAPSIFCEPDPEDPTKRRIVTDPGGRLYANMRLVDETPEEYEARVWAEDIEPDLLATFRVQVVPRMESQVVEHLKSAWSLGQMMRADETEGWAVKNPNACHRFGTCPYWSVCTNQTTLEDAGKYQRIASLHPELGETFVEDVNSIKQQKP